jgi:sterol 3beta-glucosyltransferase
MEGSVGLVGWIKTYAALAKQVKPMQAQMISDAGKTAAQFQPDLVIYHPKAMAGPHLAEKYGTPRIMSIPLPIFTPTAEFPSMIFPNWPLGGWYNKLTYTLSVKLAWMQYRSLINPWREEELGLPPASKSFNEMLLANGQPVPTIYPYSEHVIPRPADWPETTIAPGYWFLDRLDDWRPSAELAAFLDAGPPPVYVGFGSMAGKDPAKKARAAIDALQQTGQRGLKRPDCGPVNRPSSASSWATSRFGGGVWWNWAWARGRSRRKSSTQTIWRPRLRK